MVFYVAGKPTLGLGVGPTACGVTLTSPDGALVQSLVVTNSGASHCIATSDVSAILASELRKSGDSWALRRSMEQGECQIDSKIKRDRMRRGVCRGGGTGTIRQYSSRDRAARPMSRTQASGEVSILRSLAWAALAALALLVAVALAFGVSGTPTPS
jgi:hypothetical protein